MFLIDLINLNGFSLVIAVVAIVFVPGMVHLIRHWNPQVWPTRFDLIPMVVALVTIAAFRIMLYVNAEGIAHIGPSIAPMARIRDITMLFGIGVLLRRSFFNLLQGRGD